MFRVIFWLLGLVVMISLLRGVIGIVMRALAEMFSPAPKQPQRQSEVPLSGELKRDPACGTYISAATSIKENFGAETQYFCSKQCRDKYVASLAH